MKKVMKSPRRGAGKQKGFYEIVVFLVEKAAKLDDISKRIGRYEF